MHYLQKKNHIQNIKGDCISIIFRRVLSLVQNHFIFVKSGSYFICLWFTNIPQTYSTMFPKYGLHRSNSMIQLSPFHYHLTMRLAFYIVYSLREWQVHIRKNWPNYRFAPPSPSYIGSPTFYFNIHFFLQKLVPILWSQSQ